MRHRSALRPFAPECRLSGGSLRRSPSGSLDRLRAVRKARSGEPDSPQAAQAAQAPRLALGATGTQTAPATSRAPRPDGPGLVVKGKIISLSDRTICDVHRNVSIASLMRAVRLPAIPLTENRHRPLDVKLDRSDRVDRIGQSDRAGDHALTDAAQHARVPVRRQVDYTPLRLSDNPERSKIVDKSNILDENTLFWIAIHYCGSGLAKWGGVGGWTTGFRQTLKFFERGL